MSVFSKFSNTLPDSIRTIGDAGQAGGEILAVKQVTQSRNSITSSTYDDNDFLLSSGCLGQGAVVSPVLDGSGVLTSISIDEGGSGYALGDVITIVPAPGSATNGIGLGLEVTEVTTGNASAGFKSVQVTSKAPIMKSRTNSGKLITRYASYHSFSLSIGYNKLLKSEFMPLYSFLLEKQGTLKPFFVQLPQYGNNLSSPSKDALVTGATTVILKSPENERMPTKTYPSPGDLFTFVDSNNSNHTKAYMVVRVETNDDYTGSQPVQDEPKIHFTPPLSVGVSSNTQVNFTNPKIKVIMKSDATSYTLDQDNLYTFKLSLEEAIT